MRLYLDCFPCFLNQALKAARAATDDEQIQRRVLNSVAELIPQLSVNLKPPEITQQGYRLVAQIIGNEDPFQKEKTESNRAALAAYPQMQQIVEQTTDKLFAACKLAIVGNSLDLGPNFEHGGIQNMLKVALNSSLAINHYDRLLSALEDCRRLVYIGDNAGEIVFDRLLIEELRKRYDFEIYFVVRGKPVINDATMDDALAVGMDRVAAVVSNGTDAPGTILSQVSEEMKQLYNSADVIISKGQGNYESLEGEPGNVFFFLRAKCPVVAKILGVNIGDCILKSAQAN